MKKIKKNEYAYLVKNRWTKKGVKQKTVGYLGRVHKFENKNIDFFEFIENNYNVNFNEYLKNKNYPNMVKDLIRFELIKKDFNANKKVNNLLYNKKIKNLIVNINNKNIFNKEVVIKSNEGFLCNHTIKGLFNFKRTYDEEKDMYVFAEVFVNAGIEVPKEVFVELFEKV